MYVNYYFILISCESQPYLLGCSDSNLLLIGAVLVIGLLVCMFSYLTKRKEIEGPQPTEVNREKSESKLPKALDSLKIGQAAIPSPK